MHIDVRQDFLSRIGARLRRFRRVTPVLLCSTAIASSAYAADKKPVARHVTSHPVAGSQKTAAARKPAAPVRHRPTSMNASGDAEAVVATGHRHVSHGVNEVVSRTTMDHFVAGTSPMQILAQTTPGVSFQSSDALGLDTVAATLYVRGFNQTQLGVSLDGIPMGEQGFHNWYGLNVDQMEIQDNVNSITVSQGAGALSTPSTQTLGGAITFTSSDPEDKAGGRISQTFGSYNMFRTFGRVDSGILNPTGTKFYAAYARTDMDLWKGYGDQQEQQANFKLVQPLGSKGKIQAIFDYSNFTQYNFLGMTKNMWEQMGRQAAYLKPNYQKAIQWANLAQSGSGVPAEYAGRLSNDEVGDVTYDGTQIQRNYLSALTGEYEIFPNVTSRTVAYGHVSNGVYQGTNNFMTSPSSGVPLVDEAGHPDVRRLGFTQAFEIRLHKNDIQTGIWYENNSFNYPMRLYQDGLTEAHNSKSDYLESQATNLWKDSFNTNTFQFYLQDTWTIIPGMTLLGGFRSMTQTTHGGTKYDNTAALASTWDTYYQHPANGSLTASAAFLPHFNFDYHFLDHHEFYWDIAENERAYDYSQQSGSGSAWSGLGTSATVDSAQQVFNENKSKLKPERTWNYLVGYRFNSEYFSGSADFYHTDYYNRLAAITAGTTNNMYSSYINVGRETMNGADVMGTVRPFKGLAITNSFSWNDATYQTKDLPYDGSTISLKGKHQVYYPKFMYKADVTYTWRQATFNFNTSYMGSRPMTYTNDVRIPAYWASSLSASYNFGQIGFMRGFKTAFGINNLFNQGYIGGVYGAASVSGDDNPNLFAAAPRQFFGTVSAQF
ncbi:TonB-dependent receptor family protein [Acetobacter oeni]|uniref:TonB-dependent receptor n=1 Tax=Acetobacter oeni TaxID=304077 RepID=A0A511XLC5_9PROT|nr:TonB-dependent receptor [Acetobacter oeni]MBB3883521.1 iron complex outermembrane receptor protein [Acetobacter oeni]NHO19560.1 TonB-dependent receptor [Acetobacter oeni]GBR03132.1 TonB-dependent receptor [Acetobacter oeni LMG 21952]GEN63742.1 TonB-dependent receptor [Acetobacter oeni]